MPHIKYSATDANGKVHTRSSARIYTHTVVARRSYEHALARADRDDANDRDNFAFYIKEIEQGGYYATRPDYIPAEQFAERQAKDVAKAIEHLAGATSAAEYVAAQRAKRVAGVEANKAKGEYERFGSLGWCGRFDLAQKLASKEGASGYWVDLTILPAVAAVKKGA